MPFDAISLYIMLCCKEKKIRYMSQDLYTRTPISVIYVIKIPEKTLNVQ